MKKNLIFLIDANKTYTESVELEISKDTHYRILSFGDVEDCYFELHRMPDVVIMDDIRSEYRKRTVKHRIHTSCPEAKIIFISDPVTAMLENEQRETEKESYVVNDHSLVQRVKIVVDEYCFSRNFDERFDEDVVTIEGKYGKSVNILVPIFIFLLIVFLYFIFVIA